MWALLDTIARVVMERGFPLQDHVILGSDFPFPLGEHHPGKLIDSVPDWDARIKVSERSRGLTEDHCLRGCVVCAGQTAGSECGRVPGLGSQSV